jgi:NADH:ubiquinone oxidoreductase subunit 5 (subunit L)/multisubunit Na+/H+ antiporter MnhA subunit
MECTANPNAWSTWLHIVAEYQVSAQIFVIFCSSVKFLSIGIHHWLPDAMEGPTQVSALIHAATLVIAGVVLVHKFTPCLNWLPFCVISATSAGVFCYSFAAICCYDLKRIVAYSTGWHVGVMSTLMMFGIYYLQAHIITHALYKSILFVTLGATIHQLATNDSRSCTTVLLAARYAACVWCLSSSLGLVWTMVFYTKKVLTDINLAGWVYVIGVWFGWLMIITLSWSVCYTISMIAALNSGCSGRYSSLTDGHGIYSSTTALCLAGVALERNGVCVGRSLHRSTPRVSCILSGWYVLILNAIIITSVSLHIGTIRVKVGSWGRGWDSSVSRSWLQTKFLSCSCPLSLASHLCVADGVFLCWWRHPPPPGCGWGGCQTNKILLILLV